MGSLTARVKHSVGDAAHPFALVGGLDPAGPSRDRASHLAGTHKGEVVGPAGCREGDDVERQIVVGKVPAKPWVTVERGRWSGVGRWLSEV